MAVYEKEFLMLVGPYVDNPTQEDIEKLEEELQGEIEGEDIYEGSNIDNTTYQLERLDIKDGLILVAEDFEELKKYHNNPNEFGGIIGVPLHEAMAMPYFLAMYRSIPVYLYSTTDKTLEKLKECNNGI